MSIKSKSANISSNKNSEVLTKVQQTECFSKSSTTDLSILKDGTCTESIIREIDKNNDEQVNALIDITETKLIGHIPDVYKAQGTMTYSIFTGYSESMCLCSSIYESSSDNKLIKRVSYLERRNWITTERMGELRKKAQDAMKHHKIFTIRGCFYSIRKSLIQRGWVEKFDIHRRAPIIGSCQVVLEDVALQYLPQRRAGETRRQHIQKCEQNIMSRFLEHMPIDFLWSARKEKSDWNDMAHNSNLLLNKFQKSPFTTKEGLCNILENIHWFFEEGKSETYFPRSYSICSMEDLNDLIEDYRFTACQSTVRFLVEEYTNQNSDSIYAEDGQIPISSIRFALNRCKDYIRICEHFDIDEESAKIWNHDWEIFLIHYQMLTMKITFRKPNDPDEWKALMNECKYTLQQISILKPQNNLDGILNIWIVKPSNRCRGHGIHVMNDLKKIIAHVNPQVVKKGRYVVQKYIEKPLIIHRCKFDIRQWFLLTNIQPLEIWMYKESYLRFSSQQYDLASFHESVHLTNHAVQKRYENGKRDERLPPENMWDCHTFQAYLRQIGQSCMWTERIYPGMQKALIGTMLASQDLMDRRPNTFELFGADFMISEDYQPWLIEINASPDLGATTSVTARLCPQCLEDVIKVVVDYRNDPKSSTGNFELIYRQVIPPAPAYLGLNLVLKGAQIHPKNFNGKKDKHRSDASMFKNQQRVSQGQFESQKMFPSLIISPRVLSLNVPGSSKKYLVSARFKTGVILKQSTKSRAPKQISVSSYSSRWTSSCIKTSPNNPDMKDGEVDDKDLPNIETDKMKCVGSRCATATDLPMINNNDKIHYVTRRKKQQTKNSHNEPKLNPLGENSRSSKNDETINVCCKDWTQNSLKVDNEPLTKHSPTHFCAVGHTLRTWQTKFSHIKIKPSV